MTDRPDEPDLVGALRRAWMQLIETLVGPEGGSNMGGVNAAESAVYVYIESLKARADIAADLTDEILRDAGNEGHRFVGVTETHLPEHCPACVALATIKKRLKKEADHG